MFFLTPYTPGCVSLVLDWFLFKIKQCDVQQTIPTEKNVEKIAKKMHFFNNLRTMADQMSIQPTCLRFYNQFFIEGHS